MSQILSSPLTLRTGSTVKNRLLKSAMSEQLGDSDHQPTQKLARLYQTWARGGIGLSVTGNVMIDRTALGEPKNVVLDSQSDLAPFKAWAAAGTQNNTQLWMQLNHPGKQSPSFLSKMPVAPSAIPLGGALRKAFNPPRALEEEEIREIIAKFAQGAALARQAGFTGVQIHGAHGYLVSQFLSPHHNQRKDNWGGSLENRMRFVLEIYEAIRNSVGEDFPVGIKLNVSDFKDGGFTPEEAAAVAEALDTAGIDLIEISGGSYENPEMMGRPGQTQSEGYFTGYARTIKERILAPLAVTGGFRSGDPMIRVLADQAADLIGIARPAAMDPAFPNRILADPSHTISLPRVSTGLPAVDLMTMIGLTWYEYHLYTMGKGRLPDPGASPWRAVFLNLFRMGVHGFSKRR